MLLWYIIIKKCFSISRKIANVSALRRISKLLTMVKRARRLVWSRLRSSFLRMSFRK